MRTAISAVIIKDKKLLLVKKKEVWILPGGKPINGETDIACLCREVGEELSGTQLKNMHYLEKFIGKTPYAGDVLQARVYLADIQGALRAPSAEIAAAEWVEDFTKYALSDITAQIVEYLKRDQRLVQTIKQLPLDPHTP